ncbi:MAG: hypothetical protein M0Z79_13325 [Nitrospiraceae bacterium]|nr:hypothetical protein [Nitrospiraceae bacterium]
MRTDRADAAQTGGSRIRQALGTYAARVLAVLLLLAVVLLEAYYIVVLRNTIYRQAEDLKSISMELQSLKTDHTTLREELSSAERSAGEKKDGNSPDR